jgi:hypothetical protein
MMSYAKNAIGGGVLDAFTLPLKFRADINPITARLRSARLTLMWKIAVFALVASGASTAWCYKVSGNIYITDGSAKDVQDAINAAPNGAIIKLPNGKFAWDRQVTNSRNTAIHIMAESLGGTTITRAYRGGSMLVLNASSKGYAEVSGIHFAGNLQGSDDNWSFTLFVNQLTPNGLPVLIHDCSFVTGYEYAVQFFGNGGVVWNCSFATHTDCLGGITFVNNTSTCALWNRPDTLGGGPTKYGTGDPTGTLNTYVEACYFRDAWTAMSNWDDNSRVVWRYNTMYNACCASHGQESSTWGARHWEVYGCKFIYSTSGKAFGGSPYPLNLNYWMQIRGGTGVVTKNAMDEIPNKTGVELCVWSITRKGQIPCQTAYPAAHQTGQGWSGSSRAAYGTPVVRMDGIGAVSDPVYVWSNNGSETSNPAYVGLNQYSPDDCQNGQTIANYLQQNRDYFINVAMPEWTPFTYPHPLRAKALGASGSGPLPLPGNGERD